MKKIEVETLGDQVNAAVIQLPSRTYPAVAIQGDSLNNLFRIAEELRDNLSGKIDTDDPIDLSIELADLLGGYRNAYKAALAKNGLDTSFFR